MDGILGDYSPDGKRFVAAALRNNSHKYLFGCRGQLARGTKILARTPSSALLSQAFNDLLKARKSSEPHAPASDDALGKKLGLSSNTVGRIRRGDGGANLSTLDALAGEFKAPPWRLLMTPEEQEEHDKAVELLRILRSQKD